MANITNTAEQGFGNFKVVADALNEYANDYGIKVSERFNLIRRISNALDSVAEDNQICFDADSFTDVALGE